jgi:hypothetical protein
VKTGLKISALAGIAAMLLTVPASSATINIGGTGSGGLITLGGSNTDPNADVLTNGSTSGAPNGTATTNALDTGGGPTMADLTLGGTGGSGNTNGNVLLDLFGTGGGNDAAVALGSGNGTDGGAALDLFGNGGGGTGNGTGGTASPNGDLFGPSGGSNGGSLATNGIRVASLDNAATGRCFNPDATQIARLTNRHDYDAATLSGWVNAATVSIVNTGLCTSARNAIARDANVARLQAFVNSTPALKSMLAKQGRSAADVIAVDRKGSTLTLYVS